MAAVDDFKEPKLRGYTRGTHFPVTHGFSADMAIVAEPTGSAIRLGHFGPQWVKISTYGITANTVYSGQVINPIDRMLKIIGALKAWIPSYEDKIANRYPSWKTKPVVRMSCHEVEPRGGLRGRPGSAAFISMSEPSRSRPNSSAISCNCSTS